MTNLQVAYQNMLETRRSNLAREGENVRHNKLTELAEFKKQSENVRHNKLTELAEFRKLNETTRHNVATEGQQKVITDEQVRSNMANEAIKRAQNAEAARHNKASEAELERTNRAKELIDANRVAESVRTNVANEEIKRAQHILNETLGFENLALDSTRVQSQAALQKEQTASEEHRQSLMDAQKWQAYAGAANTGVNAAGSLASTIAGLRGFGFRNLKS